MYLWLMLFVAFINQFITGSKPKKPDLTILIFLSFMFFILNSFFSIMLETNRIKKPGLKNLYGT